MKVASHGVGVVPWIVVIAIIGVISACDQNRVFEENREISGGTWNVLDTISFQAEISDTISPQNIYINIRNSGTYQYSNLFMFVTTTFPNGKTSKDTVECVLADQQHWLGSGLGGLWDHQILYRSQVRFPLLGRYAFTYEQAQRSGEEAFIRDLPGIKDVGIRIEKHN